MNDPVLQVLLSLQRVVNREVYQRTSRLSSDVAVRDIRFALEWLEETIDLQEMAKQ